jgi:hypothetical protein
MKPQIHRYAQLLMSLCLGATCWCRGPETAREDEVSATE